MPTKKKKKHPKMDRLLVAAKDKNESEISFISGKYHIPKSKVREARRLVGRSRAAVYGYLRTHGYKDNLPKERGAKKVVSSINPN